MKQIRQLFRLLSLGFIDFLFPKSKLIQRLETTSDTELIALLTSHPEKREPPLPGITSLFPYRDEVVHDLVHEIKYSKNNLLASKIAPALHEACLSLSQNKSAIITFIPTTKNRREKRGFDQGAVILSAIMDYDLEHNKKFLFEYKRDLLDWQKEVKQQSLSENKEERLLNMKNALICMHPDTIKDKTVIVLDDICTTGSTLYEAKRALESVGTKSVLCITIAH